MKSESFEIPKSYEAHNVESKCYEAWIKAELFRADPKKTLSVSGIKSPYVIMMPPPNVTGSLHNGHALTMTLQDILIRYNRMCGKEALWLPGTDHAGIATQAVVERELMKSEGKSRHDLGRERFLKKIWEFKEKNGDRIIEQLKTLGVSADWSRLKFTMDEECSVAVREAFVRLWNEGLIYRGERLVSWDPNLQTALSDEEVEHVDREGELWKFAYRFIEMDAEIIVATTRPETMLGDVAVAVHPGDERYKNYVGHSLVHPFFSHREIRVIADEKVDPDFGTGAVKITPAHDANDFAMSQRHGLDRINIFTLNAKINENGGKYQGLDRYEARKAVKEDLGKMGLYRGEQKIQHAVSISQRSGVDIEPMLSRQYFVATKPLAKKAYDAVEDGETRIIPENWKKTWDHFLTNIQDWCISRQLWWGHRIPVFYDLELLKKAVRMDFEERGIRTKSFELLDEGDSISEVLKSALMELPEEKVRSFSIASVDDLTQGIGKEKYLQEEDVLDTWFSSGLWPFSTLGWPKETEDFKAFYPSSVLETGFDILFFWVARMMMLGIHFTGRPPFKDVYLHAMVRDSHGKKMSKSLGNAIDPVDVIEGISLEDLIAKTKTYPVPPQLLPQVLQGIRKDYPDGIPASGADGLRLSFAMLAGQGRDVKLAIPRVAGYRAFLNKIWNASRFALMRLGEGEVLPIEKMSQHFCLEDRWILSRLQNTIQKMHENIQKYRFSDAAEKIYQFFWTEFCDWYIEFVKSRLDESADSASRESARSVIVELLDQSMRLIHPICPFISEEIWQMLPSKKAWEKEGVAYCAVAPFPVEARELIDSQAEEKMKLLQEIISALRNAKQESNISAQKRTPGFILVDDKEMSEFLETYAEVVARLAIIETPTFGVRGTLKIPEMAAINTGENFEVAIPLEGVMDFGAESLRLEKEKAKLEKEVAALASRLQNAGFVNNAPSQVIEEHKEQLAALGSRREKIEQALSRIAKFVS